MIMAERGDDKFMTDTIQAQQDDAAAQLLKTAETAEAAGDFDRALGHFRALAEIQPTNPRWSLEAVRVLRKSDREKEATVALQRTLRRWPKLLHSPLFQRVLPEISPTDESQRRALGDDVPTDADLKRAAVEDDGAADVIIGRGGRKTAVLVFTGLADRMVMPLPLFDRYLAELDITSIFLRDQRRIGFFNGVASLGDYDETITSLRGKLDAMGIETVHTLGNSAGGMGAVSYGLDLDASKVLGFSAPVALTRAAADLDRRTAVFADRILSGAVPEERRNLRARIDRYTGDTQIHLYFGEEMPEDRYHAAALEGGRNVHLHPLPGLAGHGALFSMAHAGKLRPLFAESFGAVD
jgi:hypothetical protein